MRQALRLAKRGHTNPNPMVGAVVVKDGAVIGRAYHQKAGEPHAEALALAQAGKAAKGSTLYVTLEPCCHYGRTPPCSDAVIAAGVKRVVAAMVDPNPKVAGKGIEALRKAGVEVEIGALEQEARELNEAYIKVVTTGLPFVTLKMAMTLDGKIATRSGDSKWISGEESRRLAHRMRARADAIVIGAGTALMDDPELTARIGGSKRQPARIIVDESARLSVTARMFQKPGGDVIVATTKQACEDTVGKLQEAGARIVCLDAIDGVVDLAALFRSLAEMGFNNVLLEGGGELNAAALNAKLVDKVVIFIAPKIIGGRDAKTPVEGEGVDAVAEALPLADVRTRRCGEDLLVTARPVY